MNVLVLGSGGREHALAWKLSQSPRISNLHVGPGNAGTGFANTAPVAVSDFEAITNYVRDEHIDMVVIGPEDPLVNGLRDHLLSDPDLTDLKIIGPGALGSQLEGSKDFTKDFLMRHNIPTAQSQTFTKETFEDGLEYLKTRTLPIVLKADGLAAGKGVIIAQSYEDAAASFKEMIIDEQFGSASTRVLVEDYLDGIEVSVFILTDGEGYVILPEAKDYKRIGENDQGPNTGGMGAVSPVPFADAPFMQKVEDQIIKPTVDGLKQDNIPYQGFIFIGLMNMGGNPYVIEYNVRMGDPETQVVLPRIKNDLLDLFDATASGTLKDVKLEIDPETAVTVVMASEGYPGSYEKGHAISGLDTPGNHLVFHAGTQQATNAICTSGGRVLAITGKGGSIEAALEVAYKGVSQISWKGSQFRRDIGQDLLSLT